MGPSVVADQSPAGSLAVAGRGWGCSEALGPLGVSRAFPKPILLLESPAGIPRTHRLVDPGGWGESERNLGDPPSQPLKVFCTWIQCRDGEIGSGSLSMASCPRGQLAHATTLSGLRVGKSDPAPLGGAALGLVLTCPLPGPPPQRWWV